MASRITGKFFKFVKTQHCSIQRSPGSFLCSSITDICSSDSATPPGGLADFPGIDMTLSIMEMAGKRWKWLAR